MSLLGNCISCWELNETTGTTATDSHGSNDGTNYNCTINQSSSPTNLGKSYLMNGTSAYINCQDIGDFGSSQDFSISVWINKTANTTTNIPNIWSKKDSSSPNAGYFFLYDYNTINVDSGGEESDYSMVFCIDYGAGTLYICTGKNSVSSTLSSWIHLVCYRSGTTMGVVLNGGVPRTYTNGNVSADLSSTSHFYIASSQNSKFYPGNFDQIAMWDKALTSVDISQLYNSGAGKAYVDWDDWSNTINGVSSYSKINGIAVTGISKVNSV